MDEPAPSAFLDLPDDALAQVVGFLPDFDAARCGTVCKRLQLACCPGWESRVLSKWKHWDPVAWDSTRTVRVGQPQPLSWPQVYALRAQADRELHRVFEELLLPGHFRPQKHEVAAALGTARDMGLDSLDYLLAAFSGTDARACQLAHQSYQDYPLAATSGTEARACQLAHHFLSQAAVNAAKQAVRDLERQASCDNEYLERAAVALGTIMYPQLPPAALFSYFDSLAAEAMGRMHATEERLGPLSLREKLIIVSDLLFGAKPPEAGVQGQAPAATEPAGPPPAYQRFCCEEAVPELPPVPPTPYGLGLKGSLMHYYSVGVSMLPHVLLAGEGIPLSLCTVFLAVGHRCGLPLHMLGLPGHVMLEAGLPDIDDELIFVDCFNGHLLDLTALERMFERSMDDLEDFRSSPPILLATRMVNNVLFSSSGLGPSPVKSPLLLGLVQTALADVLIVLLHQHITTEDAHRDNLQLLLSKVVHRRCSITMRMGHVPDFQRELRLLYDIMDHDELTHMVAQMEMMSALGVMQ